MSGKRIAILGAGANGAAIGADLTKAGLDVVLIEQWPAHVEKMRADGLRIVMEGEELPPLPVRAFHLCDVATFTEPFDLVLMLFKAYDTAWATHLIAPHLAEDGMLIGVQNGMTADTIASIVGYERTLGCVIEVASEMHEPGVVIRHSPPDSGSWFALGALDDAAKGREEEVAAVMRHAGAVELTDDIRSSKWMKLVMNAMTLAPSAMLGLPLDEAMERPGMRELALKAGAEALEAGQMQGFTIQPIVGLKPEDVANTNRLLETLLDKLASFTRPGSRTTILLDHMKGRQSETDGINGLVVETLAAKGHPAPANAAIAEITRKIHAGEIEPDPENVKLVKYRVISKGSK